MKISSMAKKSPIIQKEIPQIKDRLNYFKNSAWFCWDKLNLQIKKDSRRK